MDVTLTLRCNNNCLFCPRKDYLKIIACNSLRDSYRDIEATRKISDKVVLSGGEVTIVDEIRSIIGFCKKKRFREIDIITNGRKLQDLRFAEKLVLAGAKNFAISLYSVDEKTHDRITQISGSCKETKKGIVNILKLSNQYDIILRVNLVLNYWNYKDLSKTMDTLVSWGVKNFIVAEQIIIGRKSGYLSLQEVAKFIGGIRRMELKGARLCLRGFSPCLLEDNISFCQDVIVMKAKNPYISWEMHEVDTLVKDKSKKNRYLMKFQKLFIRIDKCKSCFFKNRCLGIQKAYL